MTSHFVAAPHLQSQRGAHKLGRLTIETEDPEHAVPEGCRRSPAGARQSAAQVSSLTLATSDSVHKGPDITALQRPYTIVKLSNLIAELRTPRHDYVHRRFKVMKSAPLLRHLLMHSVQMIATGGRVLEMQLGLLGKTELSV